MTDKEDSFNERALAYHLLPKPGKLEIVSTVPMATQNDLALAYSPGVAAACNAIVEDEANAELYTARSNLVGVITNGTAVLGLGNIGPLASKPVMEGKAVLFKKFSGVDVFDIEINQPDVDKFIDTVAALEPTFGGINLEDIKAPECFDVERRLRERMNIPVFHDDQHGTAIIVAAAAISALKVVGKDASKVKLVASGAGAAALACLNQLVSAGIDKNNIIVCDRKGVIHSGRKADVDKYKAVYAVETPLRTLDEAIAGADIFLGLSGPGVLKPEMVVKMAEKPLIMALANPTPEILPEEVKAVRDDALICTGRSDYPNQVNNVLCFPYIFRGALDVGATTITETMKLACVNALSELVQQETSDLVLNAYGGKPDKFGPDYLIPKPFDPRLIVELSLAVAKAAMDSGVAKRPIHDFVAYREKLLDFVYRSGVFMRPVFERVRGRNKKLILAEGEEVRVLQAAQQVVDNEIARPILIGNKTKIEAAIHHLGLRISSGFDIDIIDPEDDLQCKHYWQYCFDVMGLNANELTHRNKHSLLAAVIIERGDADAMICGVLGEFQRCLDNIKSIVGKAKDVSGYSTLVAHILPSRTLFICDVHVTANPSVEELVELTLLASKEVKSFGMTPKVALVTCTNHQASTEKVKTALKILQQVLPELEVDGNMQADAALSEDIRKSIYPNSKLKGAANLLIMPNTDAANISVNILKTLGGGVTIGPILLGVAKPAHVVTQVITVRGLVNMSAVAVANAMRNDTKITEG